jgi:hypothetical protein
MLGTRVPRANNVPVAKLRSIIQDAGEALLSESEKMRQMAAYSMIAAATFLLPRGGNPKVPDQVLGISLSPAEIHRFNIAHMVAEGLRESARKVRETLPLNPGTITIDGCHLVLQVPLFSLFPKLFFFQYLMRIWPQTILLMFVLLRLRFSDIVLGQDGAWA